MALTSEQQARAQAWAKVFEDGPAITAVLDDMIMFIRNRVEPLERAGAWDLYGYIQERRSLLRREKTRSRKETPRG